MPMCHYCSLCQLGCVMYVWTLTHNLGRGGPVSYSHCLLLQVEEGTKECVHLDLCFDGGTGDILQCLLHL
ncbi:hypothetical protein Hamer_G002202 [Homarus americanus]|uniref:Uncharacterized protein n=1 Tax=Homarus americanus TaxID=6706 RepID=A0A8J5JRY6_HOMAM|nr:hypothetical protein Hamer_G002202 [Homarus americanus]